MTSQSFFRFRLILSYSSALLASLASAAGSSDATIVIETDTHYQTMSGWEAVAWAAQDSSPAFPNYRDELIRRAVNEAGINRIRLEVRSGAENSSDYWTLFQQEEIAYEVWRANRYATVNDNADPNELDPAGYHFSELNNTIETLVLPMREKVAANGELLYVNLNYVAFTAQIQRGGYHHDDPEEYAEFMLAAFRHMDEQYGFVPDAVEILLEPDNVGQWNGTLLGRVIVATAERLNAAGFHPDFIAPSCTNMGNAVSYFDALASVPKALDYLNEICYHRYGGVSSSNLSAIANRAQQYGLQTSMLEWWSDNNGHEILHADIKQGLNSAWQHGVLGGPGQGLNNSMTLFVIDDSNPDRPSLSINRKARLTRQYYRFVRAGARRVAAQSNRAAFDPLAFVNPNGEHVVVIKADEAGSLSIDGLPAGVYHVSYTTPSQYNVELPARAVEAGSPLTGVTMPGDGVITVLSKSVRLMRPEIDNETVRLTIETLVPGATVEIQWANALGQAEKWTTVGTAAMEGMRAQWSGAAADVGQRAFYRAILR